MHGEGRRAAAAHADTYEAVGTVKPIGLVMGRPLGIFKRVLWVVVRACVDNVRVKPKKIFLSS